MTTNQPRFDSQGFPIKPKRKHTIRNIILASAGVLVATGIASSLGGGSSPSGSSSPLPNVVTTTADTGPSPNPVTTPTNKSTAAPKTTQPSMTKSQEQAIGAAESYLAFTAFSRKGLIRQLSSDAGEGFSVADATYAVDHIKVNWNEQAAKAARSYLEMTHFSRQGLIHQLESSAGDGFTHAQAVYGVTKAGL